MPSPREQCLKYGDRSKFEDDKYDAPAGAPAGQFPMGRPQDVAANPSNPSEGTSVASNLKKG